MQRKAAKVFVLISLCVLTICASTWQSENIRPGVLAVYAVESENSEGDNEEESNMVRVRPLADDFVKVFESPDPVNVYCYTPGIARCPSGRLVATMDIGGRGVADMPDQEPGNIKRGKVFTSDDRGKTWVHQVNFPMAHARPFMAGDSLYILGQHGDLGIMRSSDEGETWTAMVDLTQGERWHQSACNVHYANSCVYPHSNEFSGKLPNKSLESP